MAATAPDSPPVTTPAAAAMATPDAAAPSAVAPAATAAAAPAAATSTTGTPAPVAPPVRIKAGSSASFTDSAGNVWLPDQGFVEGETTDRDASMPIANTKDPGIYRSEHYSMTGFNYSVPNGKYIVKLHFAETFEGITGPGERVFSFNVQGKDFNDFDCYAKTGGSQRAYVETVPIEVTDGKVHITFTAKTENPEINGIEILPAP